MKFVIGSTEGPTHLASSFSVDISLYGGDADYYQKISVDGFLQGQDEELLESLIETLRGLKTFYPSGRGGSSEYTYNKSKGFEPWFSEDGPDYYSHIDGVPEAESKALGLEVAAFYDRVSSDLKEIGGKSRWPEWPYDANCDIECSLNEFNVYFYDENLIKHAVEIQD